MAFNEDLADHLRYFLQEHGTAISEKRMFGGICFLYRGKMCVGVMGEDLMVRVLAEKMEEELEKDQVREMDFTKRPLKEFIYVDVQKLHELPYWIDLGIAHAKSKLKS